MTEELLRDIRATRAGLAESRGSLRAPAEDAEEERLACVSDVGFALLATLCVLLLALRCPGRSGL